MLTLDKFEEASEKVKEVTLETKLVYSEYLSGQSGNKVYLKPENLQYTGAYKVRGAYYKISTLSDEERKKGLITASAGNHAQGVAYAAKCYGVKAVIVMPTTTPLIKVNRTKGYGAEVILHGDVYDEACEYALKLAEEKGVKVAIENCPMLFGADQWPGGQNLFTTPRLWRKMFELLPSDNFGINYDPSHFIWQHIDYIKPLYEFKDKIFHVHFKDIKLFKDKLDDVGIMGYPLDFMSPKLPGLGDVDWGKYVSALTDIGYDGYACIEVEDKAFEGSKQRVMDSVALSCRYMRQFVI